ncbi:4-hydroxy-tetrahydrodipicolinate synthase [Mucilaginibacter calamicampi]|uniref:4-hydroxy-tetrahydrodipicolinate synthase n=1 Tax=Mucilaginibacter calamicampi TaxID=1302352 RepID=A0ABW2YW44_9SPHI
MNKFYGTGVAIITPFQANGEIDFNALRNLIEYLIEGGVEYIVSLGTTGENVVLTAEEKKKVWAFTAEVNRGRIDLVAGIGGNNTADIIEQIKAFDTTGYAGILSASPSYNKPTQEGIYQHYKAIAAVAPLPIILYNVPGRTGSNVSAGTTVRLAHDFKNIIGIKEASGNFEQFNLIMRDKPEGFLLISGDDPVTLPMMALGAVGAITVIGNALPRQTSDMVRAALNNDYAAAQKAHFSLVEFTRLCFVEGSPAGVKTALSVLGVCGDTVRLPLVQVGSSTVDLFKKELAKITA